MGPHSSPDADDQLAPKENEGCQTEATNLSSLPDGAKPIIRQNAHSSFREQENCDKNKQTSDATASHSQWPGIAPPEPPTMQQCSSAAVAGSLSTINQCNLSESANIILDMHVESSVEVAQGNDLPGVSTRQVQKPDEAQFKFPSAKNLTPGFVTATSTSSARNCDPQNNQPRRVPQRKASVFSHDGFPALNELDQKSLQQHSMRSQSMGDISADKLANKSHQQQKQVSETQIVAQKNQQQVMIAGTSKTGELASTKAKANNRAHSPQRSARPDALGSTGSSRASSCDEPTIISPLLKASPNKKFEGESLKQTSPTESSTSSLDSIDSDTPPVSTIHSAHQRREPNQSCDNERLIASAETESKNAHDGQTNVFASASHLPMETEVNSADQLKVRRKISNDSSSTRSDDVFESEAEALAQLKQTNGSSHIPPPFESIKNQIKRNSVPDAKTIRQHIDRLISQNEAIMENWNQVSIRSYNSQANTSAATDTGATSFGSARTSPKPQAADSTSGFSAPSHRPSKQRSSTTALYQGNVFSLREEQLEQLRLRHTINQQVSVNFAAQSHESRRLTQDSLDELVKARLRKRSYNSQQDLKRVPVRQTSDTSAISSMMLSPTILEQIATRNLSQFAFEIASGPQMQDTSPHFDLLAPLANPLRQNGPNDMSAVSRESLGICFNIDTKHLAQRSAELGQQKSFNQSIESAIGNLSLQLPPTDQNQQRQRHQQNLLLNNTNLLQQPEDLMLATVLADRHQQLFEDQIFQQQLLHAGKQQAAMPAALLNYIQLQKQQTLDQQASLNRLAALEQEYRQQLNDRFMASSIQQHQHQSNNHNSLMQSVDRLNERQSRESQLLNEFLAKMMLDRDDHHHLHQHQNQELGPMGSQNHHGGPILKHNECEDQRPSEMFTQPLDSATPSHRCETCDISFWTRDLLNYHLMTSCSARTGPDLARPLAFNFNRHNGFDKLVSSTLREQQGTHELSVSMSPDRRFNELDVKIESLNDTKGLDMTNGDRTQTDDQVSVGVAFKMLSANQESAATIEKDFSQSKSVSPPRRRTYHKLDAPDHQQLVIPIKHQQHLRIPTSSTRAASRLVPQPVAPMSPTFRSQRLDALRSLKYEALTRSTAEVYESNLPIKKRKISEPNMRY